MQIYITGDVHGGYDIKKLNSKFFPEQKTMTKEDYVIVCGDMGLTWNGSAEEKFWKQWLSDKPFTTLFVDGNHENFQKLRSIPLVDKFGGKVREISPGVYHLERGQVLDIGGYKFFVMGGARSHDMWCRTEGVSWWPEEMPSKEEMNAALEALSQHEWTVDFVITHCAPRSIQVKINPDFENDEATAFFELIKKDLSFKKWGFGHYHIDSVIDDQFIAAYNEVVRIV